MPTLEEIMEEDLPQPPSPEHLAALQDIRDRCHKAGIKTEDEIFFDGVTPELNLSFPAGKQIVTISVNSLEEAKALLNIQFEDFQLAGDYRAIINQKLGYIEAAFGGLFGQPQVMLIRSLFGKQVKQSGSEESVKLQTENIIHLKDASTQTPIEIILSDASPYFLGFAPAAGWGEKYTLQIINCEFESTEQAIKLLEKIAHSLFFQIDLNLALPLTLIKKTRTRSSRRKQFIQSGKQLIFPTTHIDVKAMSLYWYARSARAMPLLQFIGFYQVVEFFFPSFSAQDTIRKLRNFIKDPRFDIQNDLSMAKLLVLVKPARRGFGSEFEQLLNTLRACIVPNELREFLNEEEDRKAFFETHYKSVSKKQLPLRDANSDLITETAHRVYDIRCRIIHTKEETSEAEIEPLLPFSKEAESLTSDIELIDFLAVKVLIASSAKLNL